MESIQAIRSRIQSIGSTRQITQSMRLVSTAKVQRCRGRMAESRPFLEQMRLLVEELPAAFRDSRHPYLAGQEAGGAAVLVVSSDRGLCGGYNVNVCREALSLIERLGDARLIAVGTKANEFFRRRRRPADRSFTGVSETPFFEDAREIGGVALDWYGRREVGEVYLVYTRFQSLLAQVPAVRRLLPLQADSTEGKARAPMRFESEENSFLELAVPFYVHSLIYGAMLESSACEQSARITSMDAAVKNSDEMIDSLTLLYNQARQGAITQEITEIVGGADALARKEE